MKVRIVLTAIAAAATGVAGLAFDRLTGRDPARRAQPPAAEAERLADKLIEQQRR